MQGLRALSDRCDCLVFENDYWAIILSWNSSGLIVMSPEVDLLVSRNSLINVHFYSANRTLITDCHRDNQMNQCTNPMISKDRWYPMWSLLILFSAGSLLFIQRFCRCLFNDFVFLCWTISSFFVERFLRCLFNDFVVDRMVSFVFPTDWWLGFSPWLSPFSFLLQSCCLGSTMGHSFSFRVKSPEWSFIVPMSNYCTTKI